jgi:tungstate transport system ATP-binding protein
MQEPLYRLDRVTQRYGDRAVVSIEEMAIPRGEILAVVGPSGAGKSTLLRLLNFLERPSTGEITFRGETYGAQREPSLEVKRKATTVFQRPVLLHRSVAENVVYGLRLRGERDAAERVDGVLSEVGLSAMAKQSARTCLTPRSG